jgi:hypothetical protein
MMRCFGGRDKRTEVWFHLIFWGFIIFFELKRGWFVSDVAWWIGNLMKADSLTITRAWSGSKVAAGLTNFLNLIASSAPNPPTHRHHSRSSPVILFKPLAKRFSLNGFPVAFRRRDLRRFLSLRKEQKAEEKKTFRLSPSQAY